MSPSMPPTTPTSATATSTRASPRWTRTATGSNRGASRGNGPGQFKTPHAIATDAKGNVYVADRGNHRIQVFDGDGNFQRQIVIDVPVPPDAKPAIGNIPGEAQIAGGTFAPGSPWTICITPGPNQVLYSADAWPGRIYKLSLDGKVLGMLGESGKQLKQFGWIHGLACPSENSSGSVSC